MQLLFWMEFLFSQSFGNEKWEELRTWFVRLDLFAFLISLSLNQGSGSSAWNLLEVLVWIWFFVNELLSVLESSLMGVGILRSEYRSIYVLYLLMVSSLRLCNTLLRLKREFSHSVWVSSNLDGLEWVLLA